MFALVCNCWHYVPLSIAIQCQEQQDPALEGESSAGAAEDGWRAECHPQPSQSLQLLNYFQPATEDCTWNRIHSSLALQKLQIFNFRFLFCAFPARQPTDPSTLPFDLCVWDWYWVLLRLFFPVCSCLSKWNKRAHCSSLLPMDRRMDVWMTGGRTRGQVSGAGGNGWMGARMDWWLQPRNYGNYGHALCKGFS